MMWAAVALASLSVLFTPAADAATIEVTARLQHATTIPLAPAGRAGDAYASHWIVRDRHGRAVGDMLLDCRWVTAGLRLCVGQLSMPLGAIAVLGASRTALLGQFSVVGGTGRYVGADGTMLFNATGRNRFVLSINYETEGGTR